MTAKTSQQGLHRLPVTEPDEFAASQLLSSRLDQISTLITRYEKTAELTPKPSTELGDDDRRTSFLQLSHFVAASMHMATDTLSATATLLKPEPGKLEHRLTAQFPLLRSTIEASATALWLLRPNDQRMRIVRLLQLRCTDITYDLRLAKAAAEVMTNMDKAQVSTAQRGIRDATRRKKKHLERIDKIAAAERIAPEEFRSGAPGLEKIIDEAANDDGKAATIWRVISGLSHPSPLRFVQTSRAETTADNGDGTLHVLSSMNFQNTTVALLCAMLLYRQATAMRATRMIRPHSGDR